MTNLRTLLPFTLILLLSAQAWGQGAWPTTHADASRTGRADLAGEIVDPAVVWQQNTGGRVRDEAVLIADVNGDARPEYLVIVGGAVVTRRLDGTLLWDTPALGLTHIEGLADLNGDGRAEVLARGAIFAIFDGASGRELWRVEGEDGLPLVNSKAYLVAADDDPEIEVLLAIGRPVSMALYDFGAGWDDDDARKWTNEDPALPTAVYRPVIGNFDGSENANRNPDNVDGFEVALLNQDNCRLLFIDLGSGETRRITPQLTEGRFCYGLIQAADVDADGADDVLFTGAAGNGGGSVGATMYSYAREATLWQYEYATGTAETSTLTPAGALGDLDGDGKLEVALAVFNNTEELGAQDGIDEPGRWVVAIYDAGTGALRAALPNRVSVGFADVDDDDASELITRSSVVDSVRIPARGEVSVLGLVPGGGVGDETSVRQAQVVVHTPRDFRVNSRESGVAPAVFHGGSDGRGALLVTQFTQDRRNLMLFRGGRVAASTPIEDGVALTFLRGIQVGGDEPLAMIKTDIGRLRAYNPGLELVDEARYTGHLTSALAGPGQVLFRDSGLNLVSIDGAAGQLGESAPENWRRPVASGASEFLTFDLDGSWVTAQAGVDTQGVPFLEVVGVSGGAIWRREFPEALTPPSSLLAGQFGGSPNTDLAGILRGLDGTRRVVTIDGDSGETIQEYASAQTPPLFELLRLDDETGDGLNELLLMHLVSVERVDGATLETIPPVLGFPQGDSRPVNNTVYAGPDGPAVFANLFRQEKLALRLDEVGTIWQAASEPSHNQVEGKFAGFADANGDGLWDIAMPGVHGDIVVFNGLTGEVVRRLCLRGGSVEALAQPATPDNCVATSRVSAVAVGDVDGDGDDDYVVGTPEGWLHAIDTLTGASTWNVFLLRQVGDPILADFDEDGLVEVVAPTANSRLVGIDQAAVPAVDEVREVVVSQSNEVVEADIDIDVSARTDALGIAWDPSEGAEQYTVTLLTENLNQVVEPVVVQDTQHVFTALSLVPGARYFARVTALGPDGAARPTPSDGVLVVSAGPMITGFQAIPNPFDPAVGESTLLGAQITAPAGLSTVELEIWSQDDPTLIARAEVFAGDGAERFELAYEWDGTDVEGVVPYGLYKARLLVFDTDGAAIADEVDIALEAKNLPEEDTGEGTPDVGIDIGDGSVVIGTGADREPCCSCSSVHAPAGRSAAILAVLGLLGLILLIRRRRALV